MKLLLLSFSLALHSLMRNKMRSSLTLWGMVFGIGAVMAVVAMGELFFPDPQLCGVCARDGEEWQP